MTAAAATTTTEAAAAAIALPILLPIPPVPPAVPVTGFALSPGHSTAGVIDMMDKAGSILFSKGAEALPICQSKNGDRGFDGKINHLKLFMSFIKQRANVFD
eukprot:scaffold40797_cov63-Attheya_sp.AAC.2